MTNKQLNVALTVVILALIGVVYLTVITWIDAYHHMGF